jgi:hypothetical protein
MKKNEKALAKAKKSRAIKNKYMLSPQNSPITASQLVFLFQKTPQEHIYTRPAKGGGTWNYVTGTYVKKVLNYCFGWRWDFEIKEHGREGDLVYILGRLTIKDKNNNPVIVKEQFGRADIKYKRGTKDPLDYGNDLKSATTDALKKCASEIGIASDVYGGNEFKEILNTEKPSRTLTSDDAYKKTLEHIRKVDPAELKDLRTKISASNIYTQDGKIKLLQEINAIIGPKR